MPTIRAFMVVALAFAAARQTAGAAVPIQVIAVEGQPAPGANPPGDLQYLDLVGLNNRGDILFVADSHSSDGYARGIWLFGGGTTSLLAQEQDPIPGLGPELLFHQIDTHAIVLNDLGQVAFHASIDSVSGGEDGEAIWRGVPGDLQMVVRDGDPAPGLDAGVYFNYFRERSLVLNNAGAVAFYADLSGTGISNDTLKSIWAGSPGNLRAVAVGGDLAPGGPDDGVFGSFDDDSVVLADDGSCAFEGLLSGAHGTNAKGIWVGNPHDGQNELRLLAATGTQAPGTGGGVFVSIEGRGQAISSPGQVLHESEFSRGDDTRILGLWVGTNQNASLIAHQGSEVPGAEPGTTFQDFRDFSLCINASGDVAFKAYANSADGTEYTGIWSGSTSNLGLIVRQGDPVPGGGPGTVFSGFAEETLTMNASGQLAFVARTDENGSSGSSLWVTTVDGDLMLVAKTGDEFEIGPGQFRTLTYFWSGDDDIMGGGEDGRLSYFNDSGQVAFIGQFSDGSRALLFAPIPEPDIGAILGLLLGLLAMRIVWRSGRFKHRACAHSFRNACSVAAGHQASRSTAPIVGRWPW